MKKLCFVMVGWSSVGSQFMKYCRDNGYEAVSFDRCKDDIAQKHTLVLVYVHETDDEHNIAMMRQKYQKYSGILVSLSDALTFTDIHGMLGYSIDGGEMRMKLPSQCTYNAHHPHHGDSTFAQLLHLINSQSNRSICNVYQED
ncbi:hypothetical protein MK079_00570 [Candidatus Gracilibacteria bacterium]|nr:hypothetical protein [Candidatus Gracilibacteria bacterium]